jgi:hypothetical protein
MAGVHVFMAGSWHFIFLRGSPAMKYGNYTWGVQQRAELKWILDWKAKAKGCSFIYPRARSAIFAVVNVKEEN